MKQFETPQSEQKPKEPAAPATHPLWSVVLAFGLVGSLITLPIGGLAGIAPSSGCEPQPVDPMSIFLSTWGMFAVPCWVIPGAVQWVGRRLQPSRGATWAHYSVFATVTWPVVPMVFMSIAAPTSGPPLGVTAVMVGLFTLIGIVVGLLGPMLHRMLVLGFSDRQTAQR